MNTQIYKIASFPLNLLVLPGEEVPLRIFEPRYKQLIEECLQEELPFGIPYEINGEPMGVGSEVEIVKLVGRNSNDDMVITIKGKSLFKAIDFIQTLPNKLYGGVLAELIDTDFTTTNPEIAVRVKSLKLNINSSLGTLVITDSINMLDIAKSIMLRTDEKYRFVTLKSKEARENYILKQLNFVEQIRKQESELENNFQLN